MDHIIPEKDLRDILLRVAKPGRYTGGEFGTQIQKEQAVIRAVLSYPDLYEIGMSNAALKILYSRLNAVPGVSCERIFAPAPDFEEELRKNSIPLYSLESGRVLKDFDVVCFSVGYELTVTNILSILDLGNIELLSRERTSSDPIVIAGGPSITNPVPFSRFIDCFFIGEAEGIIEEIFSGLCEIKAKGGTREDLLGFLLKEQSIWSGFKTGARAKKHSWTGFSENDDPYRFPIPNIDVIQNQGVTEIMRGCPNACRFCHASIYYRPFRYRRPLLILREIEHLIFTCGYRVISLSSLSSGDYPRIDELTHILSLRYRDLGVSFALPSLRIDSLALSLLKEISSVRKSGLTFAVETPEAIWQAGVNKNVPLDKTITLLKEAKKQGWKTAKFYFMIGLPLYEEDESDAIISCLDEVQKATHMQINVNISTFVPKPHTPFQWAAQLTEDESLSRIMYIKKHLNQRDYKISYHSPFSSVIEGMISRGNEDTGNIIMDAFSNGARLDAWDDYIRPEIWRSAIAGEKSDVLSYALSLKKSDEVFPWDSVNLGVSKQYLRKEWEKAMYGELTSSCSPDCTHQCGVCGKDMYITDTISEEEFVSLEKLPPHQLKESIRKKILFTFAKKGKAAFLSHLNCMQIFERAFLRAGYLVVFTQGFNPKPIIEFASPLALGIESGDEIFSIELKNFDSIEKVIAGLNSVLPVGFEILKGKELPPYREGTKKISPSSIFWGADYLLTKENDVRLIIHIFSQINDIMSKGNAMFEFAQVIDSFFMIGQALCIRFRMIEKKGMNITSLVTGLTGTNAFESGITITRIASLACGPKGEPVHYFDVM